MVGTSNQSVPEMALDFFGDKWCWNQWDHQICNYWCKSSRAMMVIHS